MRFLTQLPRDLLILKDLWRDGDLLEHLRNLEKFARKEQKFNGSKNILIFFCRQYNHFTYSYQGIENCLTLNVFVPKKVAESRQKVPVIFFIHGGKKIHKF